MNRDQVFVVLQTMIGEDWVVSAKPDENGNVMMDIKTLEGRSQVVVVNPGDEHVVVFSQIGPAPDDASVLKRILEDNITGCYSRLCIINDVLCQVYKYELSELEPLELAKAIIEVAGLADTREQKYFGVDNH